MNTSKWFDRQFDFSFGTDQYADVYKRLQQAPAILQQVIDNAPEAALVLQPDGKWSIKEHTGHLSVMEPIWRVRFEDIQQQKPVLTTADLTNSATSNAGFNNYSITALLERFVEERRATLATLDRMDVRNESLTSMHPRLQRPMRMIDLAYFVAEHDDHHIAAITAMIEQI